METLVVTWSRGDIVISNNRHCLSSGDGAVRTGTTAMLVVMSFPRWFSRGSNGGTIVNASRDVQRGIYIFYSCRRISCGNIYHAFLTDASSAARSFIFWALFYIIRYLLGDNSAHKRAFRRSAIPTTNCT